jgi:hypothetical protein
MAEEKKPAAAKAPYQKPCCGEARRGRHCCQGSGRLREAGCRRPAAAKAPAKAAAAAQTDRSGSGKAPLEGSCCEAPAAARGFAASVPRPVSEGSR